jgi:hypothetical protein
MAIFAEIVDRGNISALAIAARAVPARHSVGSATPRALNASNRGLSTAELRCA